MHKNFEVEEIVVVEKEDKVARKENKDEADVKEIDKE